MEKTEHRPASWTPAAGSWEETVLSWHEQISKAFKDNRNISNRTPSSEKPQDIVTQR